jgi:hypothetical protein
LLVAGASEIDIFQVDLLMVIFLSPETYFPTHFPQRIGGLLTLESETDWHRV